ncbi:hypothetical protein K457DRAFT_1882461 [Linnemannia elongata AG-77]|uniref:Uncharacterized protein n=1 Tax=Linnemannia elongata AG-77 TaxID=1314771 RepID=A0A197JBA8_9FUNG|nr:hypothetical protein K457DRAFT_1882461 [Linnemannia elongata AG-77]
MTKSNEVIINEVLKRYSGNLADFEEARGRAIGKYMAELRELCSRHSLPCDSIKMVTSGTDVGEDYFSEDMKQAFAREFSGQALHMGTANTNAINLELRNNVHQY